MSINISTHLALAFLAWIIIRCRQCGLPPGPPTLPLLGNLHPFPKTRTYLKLHSPLSLSLHTLILFGTRFTEWAKVYGEIYSPKAGSANIVVLSSPRMVRDCIDVKGAATASRPLLHVIELVANNMEFTLTQYGWYPSK
ncbi:unnamed protein product [Somion occarium]|uniref:Cytochrome P450 n=1 Tax=Somion occarium TaxID=3059160 RepID=A0ABP1DIV7_9APHY